MSQELVVRLPCVTPSLPLWRAPSDRFPLRRILHRPLRPRACGKRLPPWETRAVERVPALDSFVKGSTDPRAASCPHQHTHTHHRIAVPVLHRMPARPCCCGSDLGSVDSPAPTHPGRNFSRKRAPHSASPAPLRASGYSLSAFCRFGTDEPLPASREAGTAACAP